MLLQKLLFQHCQHLPALRSELNKPKTGFRLKEGLTIKGGKKRVHICEALQLQRVLGDGTAMYSKLTVLSKAKCQEETC